MKSHKMRYSFILVIATLALDQLTKWMVLDSIWYPPRRIVVTDFLNFIPVANKGISFGLFQSSSSLGTWIITVFALCVIIVMGIWFFYAKRAWLRIALALVIGGALGNVIDRLHLGWVVDFIDFYFWGWHWPAFNIADSAITIGVIILVIDGLFTPKKKHK